MLESRLRKPLPKSNSQANLLTNAAILTLNDFERIKKNSLYFGDEESKKKIFENQKESQHIKAKEHIKLLKEIDKVSQETEKESKITVFERNRPSISNIFANQRNNGGAQGQKEDALKEMDILVEQAKVACLRDMQLQEHKTMENMFRNREAKLDFMMELERLKELKYQEDRELNKKKQLKQGSLVIVDQIKDRLYDRLLKEEAVKREGELMRKQIKQIEDEDKREYERKRIKAAKLAKEVEDTNKMAAISKAKKKIDERDLDLQILKYNLEKDKREEEEIQERKRLQEEREKETQKLREKQEKFTDKQAALDEYRAKCSFEKSELEARLKEKEELLKRQRMMQELINENEKQKAIKRLRNEEEIKKNEEEFNYIIKKQREEIENERRIDEDMKKRELENQDQVIQQMKNKEELKRRNRRDIIEEGKEVNKNYDDYYIRMNQAKQERINYLKSLNVQDKYLSDLERYKIK